MTRGRCGSLLLHRDGLAPSTPCRSPGALRSTPINGHRQTGQVGPVRANCRRTTSLTTLRAKASASSLAHDGLEERCTLKRDVPARYGGGLLASGGEFTTASVAMSPHI